MSTFEPGRCNGWQLLQQFRGSVHFHFFTTRSLTLLDLQWKVHFVTRQGPSTVQTVRIVDFNCARGRPSYTASCFSTWHDSREVLAIRGLDQRELPGQNWNMLEGGVGCRHGLNHNFASRCVRQHMVCTCWLTLCKVPTSPQKWAWDCQLRTARSLAFECSFHGPSVASKAAMFGAWPWCFPNSSSDARCLSCVYLVS